MHSKSSYGGLGHLSRGLPDGIKSKELSFGSKLATIQSSLGQKANTITSGFVKGLSHGSDRDEIDLRKDTRASDQRRAIMSLDYVSREYAPTSKNENVVDGSGIKPEFYDEKEQSAVMANKYETENEEIELENEDSVNISIKKPSAKRKKRIKKSVLCKVKNKELNSQEGSQPEVSENQMENDLIENILKQSLNRNVRTSTGNLKKDEILNLYESKNPSLSNYRLPKLSEYFRELNYENMSYTLADRVSRTELWAKARDLMMKDRNKLQSKLEMYECTFRPQIVFNPGDHRSVRPNEHLLLTKVRSQEKTQRNLTSEGNLKHSLNTVASRGLSSKRENSRTYGQIHRKQVQLATSQRSPYKY